MAALPAGVIWRRCGSDHDARACCRLPVHLGVPR
jgi:hypothetical protein